MTWRPLLTSSVAATMPTGDIKYAAVASYADAGYAAAADAANSVEVSRNAGLWLEHANQGGGRLAIDIAPCGPKKTH